MRVAICGVSGFVGTYLSRALVSSGYEVIRVGREHFASSEALYNSLDGCEVVINLCGAPILKRWDEAYKHELYISRIETTKKILKEFAASKNRPKLYISASAVGIYEENLVHDDDSTIYGTSYLSLLCREWELEAKKAENLGIRSIIFRLGAILGSSGGAANEFKSSFKMGLGAVPGDGKQAFSWVHADDVVEVFKRAIEEENMQGVYNLVAPESVNMKTFMTYFGKAIGKRVWLNIPEKIIKIRYGEGAELITRGSFVVPSKLEKEGYEFRYGHLPDALKTII